jgi:hypothetical protein
MLAALAWGASSARATYDPLGSGTATLTLAAPFKSLLKHQGVTFSSTSPAKAKSGVASLPLAAGKLDPTASQAELDAAGNLFFKRGKRRVVIRKLVFKTKPAPLIAKVGGGQLKLATGKLRFARSGFGARLSASRLEITKKLATRLDKKLHLHGVFSEGQLLGRLKVQAQPQTVAVLPGGRATLVPDPAFLAKLDANFISFNPVAPAERAAGPVFSFPIIGGGQLAPDATLGTLRTGGALEFLQLGSGQVFWTEPWFDFGAASVLAEADIEPVPTYPGKLGQLPLLNLASGATSSDPQTRKINVSGAALSLSEAGAAQFNLAFAAGNSTFQAGESLGTVSFEAQAQ